MNPFGKLLMPVLFATLAFTGCTTSSGTEEPHLEKIHALLQQGEQAGYPEACRYLLGLDQQTRSALAARMLRDENSLVVYLGDTILVRQKQYDEAAPVMAKLITDSRNERDLQSHMEYDWQHDVDPATWPNMVSRVGRILIVNLDDYSPESRKQAEQFLVDMLHLEVNKPFSREDAVTAVLKLSRGLKQGTS